MRPNQTYKLLNSKGNHKQNEKKTYRLGGNIYKLCNRQGVNFQNIQFNNKKTNNSIENRQKT